MNKPNFRDQFFNQTSEITDYRRRPFGIVDISNMSRLNGIIQKNIDLSRCCQDNV